MERVICLLVGYALGNFQTAYIYGKSKGIDIREHGSGNAGTTNSLRVLGRKAGAVVFFGDVMKCVLAILFTKLVFGESHANIIHVLTLYAATGAILGHNYPIVLKFKGGKGMACTAGLMLSYHPIMLAVGLTVFLVTFFLTHYVSLGSILVYIAFAITMVTLIMTGALGTLTSVNITELIVLSVFLMAMAIFRHRENISRLVLGTERKTYLSKKNKS